MIDERARAFRDSGRPDVALITNHGYPGVDFPIGGALDTGGQVVYVNALAAALDALGYRVTVFARGGFPYFESDRLREEPEYLSDHARYVFVPGGGDTFLRKEDIAVALDEEVEWLDAFIREEAAGRGCSPWSVYQLVNSHYWDAAVIACQLVERWRNDVTARGLVELAGGGLPSETSGSLWDDRHWRMLGGAPARHLGAVLLEDVGTPGSSLSQAVRSAVMRVAQTAGLDAATAEARLIVPVEQALEESRLRTPPPLRPGRAAEALGEALLGLFPERAATLERELCETDRHVWTPHSLGALKQENFKDHPAQVVRDLKFCERRDHERTVCSRTSLFAATSAEIADKLCSYYGVSADSIFYFPPCVDRAQFRPYTARELASTYAYLSEVSGIPPEKLRSARVVFETSRMDQTKRKDLILDAFARVASEFDDSYLFIGGGPRDDLFEDLVRRRDADAALTGRAFLTGFIPEQHIGPLFALAAIYVSASEMEGFGMSALQAAASGAALISSDLTPFAVQYVPEDALVVAAGDVGGFAAALRHLLSDEEDRRSRVERLIDKTRELSWEAQAERFLEHLRLHGFDISDPRTPGEQDAGG